MAVKGHAIGAHDDLLQPLRGPETAVLDSYALCAPIQKRHREQIDCGKR
jgi:hypothetical protein